MIRRLALPLSLWLLALALAACGVATSTSTPTPVVTETPAASPTPSGPAATATPDLIALLRDGGIAIVQRAYDRILDEYVEPVEPSRLLDGAWTRLAQEAGAEGIAVPAKPAFADDRAGDFALFRAAYVRMTANVSDAAPLRYAAIRGMTESLQDCHTYFLSPVASTTQVENQQGKGSVGIGVELAGIPPLVTEVIAGGPGEKAGVHVGDRIVEVDGADLSNAGPAAAFERINGTEGTQVRLGLQRPGEGRVEVTATRARVVPQYVESRLLSPRIGYVRIREFVDSGIAEPLRAALTSFEQQGVASWIIDLRGNPGGRLDTAAASLFVPEGVVSRNRARDGSVEEERATGQVLPALRPTVLLTNNRTGSVAEMFAAALQEYGKAYVIGANTNGCVGFVDVQPLGDGSSLAVTTHVGEGPVSHRKLNGVGVAPDLAVPRTSDDIAAGRDPQLDAAVAYLGG